AVKPKSKPARRKMPKWTKPPAELVALHERITATNPRAERRQMFGCPIATVNGNMFFSVHQSTLVARLSESDRESLFEKQLATPFSPMPGMTMKEYVCLHAQVVRDPKRVRQWFDRAFAYAETLPPKKAKKTRKAT